VTLSNQKSAWAHCTTMKITRMIAMMNPSANLPMPASHDVFDGTEGDRHGLTAASDPRAAASLRRCSCDGAATEGRVTGQAARR
jgi:hypothetical protein